MSELKEKEEGSEEVERVKGRGLVLWINVSRNHCRVLLITLSAWILLGCGSKQCVWYVYIQVVPLLVCSDKPIANRDIAKRF